MKVLRNQFAGVWIFWIVDERQGCPACFWSHPHISKASEALKLAETQGTSETEVSEHFELLLYD